MTGRVFFKLLLVALILVAMPARADTAVQSLFNTKNNTTSHPIFLGHGISKGDNSAPHTFGASSGKSSKGPSAKAGAQTKTLNERAIQANVAKSAQNAATRNANNKVARAKKYSELHAMSAAQAKAARAKQAQSANATKAAVNQAAVNNAPPAAGTAPTGASETPLYNVPGQSSEGHAPIFGVH